MLRRTVRPEDLHVIRANQQRDAYAEVVLTCGSVLEDALREAWRYFYGEAPPDSVRKVVTAMRKEVDNVEPETMARMGVTKFFYVLRRAGFPAEWCWSQGTDANDLDAEELLQLIDIRNDIQHRRSQTLATEDNERITRKSSRDMAKACVRALVALGQLEDEQGKGWIRRITEKPLDPPVNNLPNQWYTRLIGRDEELSKLTDALQRKNFSRFALEGKSGVGKSSIAREFGMRAFADGLITQVIWVSGKERYYTPEGQLVEEAKISNKLRHCVNGILEAFAWEKTDGELPSQIAAELIGGCQRPLLILDNWESLQGDRPLEEWIDNLPNTVTVLYTSRRGVTQARPSYIEGLSKTGCTALMSDYLQDSSHWNPIINSTSTMAAIHRETEGNPLLVMLLAAIILRNPAGVEPDIKEQLFRRRRGRDLLQFMHDYNMEILQPKERMAFLVTPLITQPMRVDHFAAALRDDITTANNLLRALVEAGLAQVVVNPGASSPFGKETFRVHPYSLEYARRLLVAEPDLQRDALTRLSDFRAEGSTLLAEFTDAGHYPIRLQLADDDKNALVIEVAREFRESLQKHDFARFDSFAQQMAEDFKNCAWISLLLFEIAKGGGVPPKILDGLRASLHKMQVPLSDASVKWLIRDALDRGDVILLDTLLANETEVDLVLVHKIGVQLGQQGKFEPARRWMETGLRGSMKRDTPLAIKQRQYFTIGLAETNLQEARNAPGLSPARRRDLLIDSGNHAKKAEKMLHPNMELVRSIQSRIDAEARRWGLMLA